MTTLYAIIINRQMEVGTRPNTKIQLANERRSIITFRQTVIIRSRRTYKGSAWRRNCSEKQKICALEYQKRTLVPTMELISLSTLSINMMHYPLYKKRTVNLIICGKQKELHQSQWKFLNPCFLQTWQNVIQFRTRPNYLNASRLSCSYRTLKFMMHNMYLY